jgi:GT2 family glycosyltransferase
MLGAASPSAFLLSRMTHAEARSLDQPVSGGRSTAPAVLVVLVCRNGEQWLKQCLISLSRQDYPRLGVLAVDNASSDESVRMLESTLGPERVAKLAEDRGLSGATAEALGHSASERADFVLVLHDDTVLAPDAVSNLVAAARRMEDVGVVGPKVLDPERPRELLEVGLSVDRFGYRYSPLEAGEIDQGQYDAVRDVLAVSSCAMLVSRRVLDHVDLLDERVMPRFADLDFGWRTRIAGMRVLMTPDAVALHREAGLRGERPGEQPPGRLRYERERAALSSALKNYRLVSLAWTLPVWLVQYVVRTVFLLLTRRFEDAYQMVAALGWSVRHLPGTLRRRRRVQRERRTRDHRVNQLMAPADVRLRRWAVAAGPFLRTEAPADPDAPPVAARVHAARFAASHPVLVAWAAFAILAAIAYRHLAGASPLSGGALAAFPSSPGGFFDALASGLRSTGLGGTQAASPSLGLLGLGSALAFGSPALLQKILLLVLPAAAGVGCYRAVRSWTEAPVPSVVAASCYALSSVVLWSLSLGRIPDLVVLAGLPWLTTRLWRSYTPADVRRSRRWFVGAAIGFAVLASFSPGVLLAAGVLVLATLVVPPPAARRGQGTARIVAMVIGAGLLLFPLALELATAGGRGLASAAGPAPFFWVLRLALGSAPGAWPMALYLPLAAALCLVLLAAPARRLGARAAVAAVLSIYLAWASAQGWLPLGLTNAPAFLAVAAFCYALLVGLGIASLARGVATATFGYRQVSAAVLALILGVGLVAQAGQAAVGAWSIGQGNVPAAYALVQQAPGPPSRVLFVGRRSGAPLVAPGGPVQDVALSGASSIRYAISAGPGGASALDYGRPAAGPGYDALRHALEELLSGSTTHGGALLAPFGVRFIVAGPGDLPAAVSDTLHRQVDLVVVPAGGLDVYRDDATVGTAIVAGPTWARAARSGSGLDRAMVSPQGAVPLEGGGRTYRGPAAPNGSLVTLSQQFDGWWRLRPAAGGPAPSPTDAFGWTVGFLPQRGVGPFEVVFTGQWIRTIEIVALALLWAWALWITRRPVRDV